MSNTPTKKELKARIRTWSNRAEMALQQGQTELAEQALACQKNLEAELAKLEEHDLSDE